MKAQHIIISFAALILPFLSFAAEYEDLLPADLVIQEVFEPGLEMPVGMVTEIQDHVIVIHEHIKNQGFELKNYLPLFKDDLIVTSRKGMVQIKLNDGSLITLASLSKLEINRSLYDPETQNRSSFLKMSVGKARFLIKKLFGSKQADFKVKTSTAVVGVRGTTFLITADERKTGVTTGKDSIVEVTGGNSTVVLSDLENIVVETGVSPAPDQVARVPYDEFLRIEQNFEIRHDDIPEVSPASPPAAVMEKKRGNDGSRVSQIVFDDKNILIPDDALVEPEALSSRTAEDIAEMMAIPPENDAAVHNAADKGIQDTAADQINQNVTVEVRDVSGRIAFPPPPE